MAGRRVAASGAGRGAYHGERGRRPAPQAEAMSSRMGLPSPRPRQRLAPLLASCAAALLTCCCGFAPADSRVVPPSATSPAVPVEASAVAAVVSPAFTATATTEPSATPTEEPTATPRPTATPVAATETPTSVADEQAALSSTATASADQSNAAWSAQAREVHRINQTLAKAGQGYQDGTVGESEAMAVLVQADRDAAAIVPRMRSLPPPTTGDAGAPADVLRAAQDWSTTLHALHRAADDRDFFTGFQLVGQLQANAQRLDAALDRLHLPADG